MSSEIKETIERNEGTGQRIHVQGHDEFGSALRSSIPAMHAARMFQELARGNQIDEEKPSGVGEVFVVPSPFKDPSNIVYQSLSRSRTSEERVSATVSPRAPRPEHSPQTPRHDDSTGSSDPFAPNRELYQAFVRSAADNHTRAMAERLMQQLSELSRKVGTLTSALDHEKRTNAILSAQLRSPQSGQLRPEDSTLHRFLIAIRESSVLLAAQLSSSTKFPSDDGQLNSAITSISSALEASTRAVASCRRSLEAALGQDGGLALDALVGAAVSHRGHLGGLQHEDVATTEHNVLSRVIDILGGDASQFTTLEDLRHAAPSTATAMRSTMEQTLREKNAVGVALREYERRAQQMLRACGVNTFPSAQELVDNGGVGGRGSFDQCLESAQWINRIVQRTEQRCGFTGSAVGTSLQDRLGVLLRIAEDHSSSSQLESAIRNEVIPLLPRPISADASYREVCEGIAAAIRDATLRQMPRQSSSAGLGSDPSDILLGELMDTIDCLATDRAPEWAAMGHRFGLTLPAGAGTPSQPSLNVSIRRNVTHGDVAKALERLKARLASFAESVSQTGTTGTTDTATVGIDEISAAASNQRALHALAQLIPKTTISSAVPSQQRSRSAGSSHNTVVLPPTNNLDEMVSLISERIDLLHQSLQKSFKQSDVHRVERARLEELIQVKGPTIARALQNALASVRFANPDEDLDNDEIEGVLKEGQLPQYPPDTIDSSHTHATFFEPIISDIAARSEALRVKCARLSNNHKTDRQRIANYASSQAVMLKRWQKTVGEVVNIARLVGVDSSELVRSLGDDHSGAQTHNKLVESTLPPSGASTALCADMLRRVQSKLQGTLSEEVLEEGARLTELHDLRDKVAVGDAQREMFAKTISVMLSKLAEVGRYLKRCMFFFGPDDTDFDDLLEQVLADGRVASSDDDEEALGAVIKKLVKWSARLDNVSGEHARSLQKLVKYFNGAHAVLCGAEAEVHDANILDADETLVRVADGILMALNDKPEGNLAFRQARVAQEITPEGEGRFIGADQDHRLIRIHSVVTKLHQAMDALLKGRYLAISGLMDEDSADRTSDSSPSRVQSAFLDIDPETTALTTTELVRLVEQNLRHVDGCLSRFSIGHKQAAIYIQKDVDSMQTELAAMLGHLSQFDVQETFGIDRTDLRSLYDVLKDRPGQRGSYFFNRSETGEGHSPWVTALSYLSQTYGPTLELLASKAESQRWFKCIVDKSMDEAALYIQWCRDREVALPKVIQENTVGDNEIELIDEHLPVVLHFAAEKAMGMHQGISAKKHAEQLATVLEKEKREAKSQQDQLQARIQSLTNEVAELHVQKDALVSEAAMARAQLRRINMAATLPPGSATPHRPPPPRSLQNSPTVDDGAASRGPRVFDPPAFKSMSTTSPRNDGSAPREDPHHSLAKTTTPTRYTSPVTQGYSNRPQTARAPLVTSVSGYARRSSAPSASPRDETLQVVASHPTVREYVKALCNELESRHRSSPYQRGETPPPQPYHSKRASPSRSTAGDGFYETKTIEKKDEGKIDANFMLGPQSYNPATRSKHHRQPIASPNTSTRDHLDSPDSHCRKGTCGHPHHHFKAGSHSDSAALKMKGRSTPSRGSSPSKGKQAVRSANAQREHDEDPTRFQKERSDKEVPPQRVVIMPRTVMIVGPKPEGIADSYYDNGGDYASDEERGHQHDGRGSRRDKDKVSLESQGDADFICNDQDTSNESEEAHLRYENKRSDAQSNLGARRLRESSDRSPSVSDSNNNNKNDSRSRGSAPAAEGAQVVHIRNSEIALDKPKRASSSEKKKGSTGRWRM